MPSAAPEPLLEAEDLRVDVDGVPACDGLTLRTTGRCVLVLGAPRALFEAVVGEAPPQRGALLVRGVPAREAARRGIIAGAAAGAPLPPRWTVEEYVTWSARLAGASLAGARARAQAAIAALELGPLAKTPTSALVVHARRGAIVASALATGAEILALDDPLGGLAEDAAASFGAILGRALADRPWIVFAPRMPLRLPLALQADEAIVTRGGARVEAQGRPVELASAERRFAARLIGSTEALGPLLAERGASLEPRGERWMLDLGGEMSTSELMALCDRSSVAVLELVPVSRALS